MKATLFALFVGLLMVGCGDGIVEYGDLEDRNGVMYLPNEETPFTGRTESFHENGQKKGEVTFKDGKPEGPWTGSYENGQKKGEGKMKDGKLMEAVQWKPNGEKCPVTNLKDGSGVVVWYFEDGTVSRRDSWKDGKLDGISIHYYEDGTEKKRVTY